MTQSSIIKKRTFISKITLNFDTKGENINTFHLSFILSILFVSSIADVVCSDALSLGHETYQQRLTIHLENESAATNAHIRILPLPDGKKWAITARWDDNSKENAVMCDTMTQSGIKGTFYLNRSGRTGLGWDENIPYKIIESGNSIGGHGWSHPMLGYCSRNRMFEEILRCRIQWETITNASTNTYAFSYVNHFNSLERQKSARDIAELLIRSGFYGIANRQRALPDEAPFSYVNLIGGEYGGRAEDITNKSNRILKDSNIQKNNPCLSYSMHAWTVWGKHDIMKKSYDLLAHNPSFWYCVQDDYAAYRWQRKLCNLTTQVTHNTIEVVLDRPSLRDANRAVPLSFAIDGVPPEQILNVVSNGTPLENKIVDGNIVYNLPHAASQQLVEKIGWIKNDKNQNTLECITTDEDFPKLQMILFQKGKQLILKGINAGTKPLKNVRVCFRLPLAYSPGYITKQIPMIQGNGQIEEVIPLVNEMNDSRFFHGKMFFAAQLDFEQNGEIGRLYATTNVDGEQAEDYPNGGFIKLGPIPRDEFDIGNISGILNNTENFFMKKDGTKLLFEKNRILPEVTWYNKNGTKKTYISEYDSLSNFSAELLVTAGLWSVKKHRQGESLDGFYILRSTVYSDKKQPAMIISQDYKSRNNNAQHQCIDAIYLNGEKKLTGGKNHENQTLQLKKGANKLVIIAQTQESALVSPQNMGVMLRLASPSSQERLENIRYVCPE